MQLHVPHERAFKKKLCSSQPGVRNVLVTWHTQTIGLEPEEHARRRSEKTLMFKIWNMLATKHIGARLVLLKGSMHARMGGADTWGFQLTAPVANTRMS